MSLTRKKPISVVVHMAKSCTVFVLRTDSKEHSIVSTVVLSVCEVTIEE